MNTSLTEEIMKDKYELYNRIKNQTRKKMLQFIYQKPRNYKELAEYVQLKPGSLYHHLGVLEPLVFKSHHGVYEISSAGKEVVESTLLVDKSDFRPQVSNGDGVMRTSQGNQENFSEKDEIIENKPADYLLYQIWLAPTNYIISGITLLIVLLLGLQGIAFAGSAIYAIGGNTAFAFDIVALILGVGLLYLLETILQSYPVYSRFKFVVVIRLISMFPGVVVGISLLLLFNSGVALTPSAFPIIFVITLIFGTISATIGIHYLRNQTYPDSLLYALLPANIDLLLGFVVIVTY